MYSEKPSVLACVTSQYECDRIIDTARSLADERGAQLRVVSVLKPTEDYSLVCDQIEYLDRVAKDAGADMTIFFADDAARACAQFAFENGAYHIVTGMHDGGDESFLVRFNRIAPAVSITMVDKDNTAYTMEASPCRAR